MSTTLLKKHVIYLLLAPCLFLASSLLVTGCGGEEEAPPAEETPAAPEGESAAAAPEEQPDLTLPDGAPETLTVLRFMPADAQVAIALPALPGLRDELLPLAKALADPDDDLDAEMAEAIQELAGELGVEAASYEELAAALGVDHASPVAAFGDFRKTVTSAAEAKAKYESLLAEEKAGEATAAEPLPDGVSPEGSEPSPEEADEPEFTPDYFEDAEDPEWVVVLGLADPDKARAELERIAGEDETLGAIPSATEDVDGITITTRDAYGYFTTDTHIALGNSDLLRGAALRVKAPATFRYGTDACPASTEDEAVALIYGGRFMPLLETALPLFGSAGGAGPMMAAQMATYKAMFTEGGEDPMVLTLSMNDDRLEVLSRVDSETHPGLMALTGPATPLRLARYLPENTLAMLSLRFNDEFKQQLTRDVLPAVSASGEPSVAGAMGIVTQVVNQIGDELTIGITSAGADLPGIYLMVGLSQPETTQGLLQMIAPTQGAQTYEGYAINSLDAIPGMPLHLSFVDNILLAGNSEAGIKNVIDLHKAQKASSLFASLEPPMDIDSPVYQTFVFNTKIIQDAAAAAAMFPGAAAGQDPDMARVTGAIREVRAVKNTEGTWLTSRLTVYLNDLEAAAAAAAATAAAAEAEAEAPVEGATAE